MICGPGISNHSSKSALLSLPLFRMARARACGVLRASCFLPTSTAGNASAWPKYDDRMA